MSEPFEIRRRASIYFGVGLVAGALAVMFGLRAYADKEPMLWILVAVLALVAYLHLIAAVDARTPLFVADDQGVRLRSGHEWVGFRWPEMGDIRIERREGIRHDPRVKVLSGDGSRIYTAPLGFATNSSPAQAEVQLARRRSAAAY
ncbi:MAG: hypothetical protein ABIR57_14885 [Aeromicrobium sp.]